MQDRPNFSMAQNAATAFLLRRDIKGIAFKPRSLDLSDDGIIIDTIGNYAHIAGRDRECFTARNADNCYTIQAYEFNYIILYDETCSSSEHTDFGISHELGHIYCGHTEDGPLQEIEANFFAAQLLMPEIVCYYIMNHYLNNRLNAWDLMDTFGVSFEAANKRINTFNRRGCFSTGKKDLALLEKYKPFAHRFFSKEYINTPLDLAKYEMIV